MAPIGKVNLCSRGCERVGADLISDGLTYGRLWYAEPNAIRNAIGYAKLGGLHSSLPTCKATVKCNSVLQ